jgi:hypothetical protein
MAMYRTVNDKKIYKPDQYAQTGAPMFNRTGTNINKPTSIYEVKCANGKRYIGKTANLDRRMKEHFTGRGSEVTKKFEPHSAREIAQCSGYFSNEVEQHFTKEAVNKYGYGNVRGGSWVNSKTLSRSSTRCASKQSAGCYRCGRTGHLEKDCYASTHIDRQADLCDNGEDYESSENEQWVCSFCNKEFESEKGARFHEMRWCKHK